MVPIGAEKFFKFYFNNVLIFRPNVGSCDKRGIQRRWHWIIFYCEKTNKNSYISTTTQMLTAIMMPEGSPEPSSGTSSGRFFVCLKWKEYCIESVFDSLPSEQQIPPQVVKIIGKIQNMEKQKKFFLRIFCFPKKFDFLHLLKGDVLGRHLIFGYY